MNEDEVPPEVWAEVDRIYDAAERGDADAFDPIPFEEFMVEVERRGFGRVGDWVSLGMFEITEADR